VKVQAGPSRRRILATGVAVLLAALAVAIVPAVQRAVAEPEPTASGGSTVGAAASAACTGDHWVGAWTAAPQSSSIGRPDDADGPARVFTDQTLRMIVSAPVDGSALRVRLGNRFGTAPVAIDGATVGLRKAGAALEPGSVQALTFGGSPSVVIAPGTEATSDPVTGAVVAFRDVAVSFHVVGSTPLDQHQWAQSTQYASPAGSGDASTDESGTPFTDELSGWFGIASVEVLTPSDTGAVVALGDSITDGIGSTFDADRRWPDVLARRFASAGISMSVVNAGLAGNHVATSGLTSMTAIGPAAQDRVVDDALAVPGATDLVVFEGINDIFTAEPGADVASKVIAGYDAIIERAHAAGLRVVGATVTPAGMTGDKEAARQAVNEWIRTSGAFDAVVDFDAVVRSPQDPTHVRPEWDAHLAHLDDDGYAALANAIDLDLFQGTGC
jgi:lysophospholipase L1-like esterase